MMSSRSTSSVEYRKQPINQLTGFLCERLRLRPRGRTWALCVAAFAGGLALAPPPAHATPVTEPTALSLGDQYRLAFVTSTTRDATSSDIADYNAFVAGVASSVPELNALGATWKAIASTASVDAHDNTNTNPATADPSVPIYLLDGTTKIANTNSDLWDGFIDDPLNVDENGSTIISALVWTGTRFPGHGNPNDELGSSSDESDPSLSTAIVGSTLLSSLSWIATDELDTANSFSIYAMSDVLTISDEPDAVPEPGTLTLMGLGLVGLAAMRRRLSTLHRA